MANFNKNDGFQVKVFADEDQLIMGGILDEDEIIQLRNTNKSAPPDLYLQQRTVEENQYLYDKQYYDYYNRQKNPRLPKPLYRRDVDSDINQLMSSLKISQNINQTSQQQLMNEFENNGLNTNMFQQSNDEGFKNYNNQQKKNFNETQSQNMYQIKQQQQIHINQFQNPQQNVIQQPTIKRNTKQPMPAQHIHQQMPPPQFQFQQQIINQNQFNLFNQHHSNFPQNIPPGITPNLNNSQNPLFQPIPVGMSQNVNQNIINLFNHLIESCKDQNSSRTIQKQFEAASLDEKNSIFYKILPEAFNLMKDQFGNYVIQKLFEKGTKEQKQILYQMIKGKVEELSLHTYGCRVIQKALEELKDSPDMQEDLIQELNQKIMTCIQDQHGNHVIQKFFETVQSKKLLPIINEVIQNVILLYNYHFFFLTTTTKIKKRFKHLLSTLMVVELYKEFQNLVILEKPKKFSKNQWKKQLIYANVNMEIILFNIFQKKGLIKTGQIFLQQLEKILLNYHQTNLHLMLLKNLYLIQMMNSKKAFQMYYQTKSQTKLYQSNYICINLQIYKIISFRTGIVKLTKNAYGNYVVQRLYEKSNFETKMRICMYIFQNQNVFNEVMSNNYGILISKQQNIQIFKLKENMF
ncbi:pumilio-family RNA binding repeat protein [Ichthyophthirius multifiliis]|uniref:Pumilio-family RNA binding repeat protein n=1 Tax=Ichthyophthirius multifiliis TaxID=5932 RepID=G0QTP3_ICHMU|nr:pumilio-family RNA binding repeat protein [Ichthyophthirius multifiliis]EGR31416.1 pumilio-family RNA binding repeat protein [Ichthyophthirius multifiliis]|eukprot:XP_004034902.1 pumilio-family RNA binding repeat protein [Ichthyophthirius multifiliis]